MYIPSKLILLSPQFEDVNWSASTFDERVGMLVVAKSPTWNQVSCDVKYLNKF